MEALRFSGQEKTNDITDNQHGVITGPPIQAGGWPIRDSKKAAGSFWDVFRVSWGACEILNNSEQKYPAVL